MRKLLLLSVVFISLLYFLILLYNTLIVFSKQSGISHKDQVLENENEIFERISRSIQIPVLSEEKDSVSLIGMHNFTTFLNSNYTELHSSLDLKVKELNKNIFLYRLKGRNEKMKPILFVFKLDVKDPDLKTMTKWSYQPFSGKIAKGFIWGAGAMGDKTNCTALFEALETLLKKYHQTQRTIYIALVKEEPNSLKNNELLAELLKQEEEFEMVLGCRSFIITENVFNINKKIALINCAEKGSYELEIGTETLGNQPEPEKFSCISWKNRAIKDFMTTLAPELNFSDKFQICNYHLFGSFISSKLSKDKFFSDMLFDKVIINSIKKDNKQQIIGLVYAVSPEEIYKNAKLKISKFFKTDNIQVKNSQTGFYSNCNNFPYEMLQSSARQTFGELIVIPGIGPKPTYLSVYKNLNAPVYHFSPLLLDSFEKIRYESGIDERISVENYKAMIKFYRNLFVNILF